MVCRSVVLLLLTPSFAEAKEVFVDAQPNKGCPGSYDVATRSCTGGETSFATIQAAANVVKPGDLVTVRDGTYHQNVEMKSSGVQGNPITFRVFPGEKATVDCTSGCSGLFAVYWKGNNQGHDWIVWDGIDVKGGALKYSLWLEGHNNVVQNSEISYSNNNESMTGATCLEVMRSDGSVVRNNDVHHCGWNGISITDTNDAIVEGNVSHDTMHHNCLQFMSATQRPAKLWSGNIARYNRLYNCRHGVYVRYQQNLLLQSNVIYRATRAGIYFTNKADDPLQVYVSNTEIYNNTIVGGHPQAETWEDGIKSQAAKNLTIKNNILASHNSDAIDLFAQVSTGHVVDNNLYFDTFRCSLGGKSYQTLADWKNSPQVGANGVFGDPSFVNIASHDYALGSGSLAIDKGADLGTVLAQGLAPSSVWPDGVTLAAQDQHGAAWEIGAFVYGETVKTPDSSVKPSDGSVMETSDAGGGGRSDGGGAVKTPDGSVAEKSDTHDQAIGNEPDAAGGCRLGGNTSIGTSTCLVLVALVLFGRRRRRWPRRGLPLLMFVIAALSTGQATAETFTKNKEMEYATSYGSQRNCIVTHKANIYMAYVDSQLRTWIARRASDGSVKETLIFANTSSDGHNGPSVGIDRDGYIHVVGDMHQDPWRYKVSDKPEDISSFTLISADSSRRLPGVSITYPFFSSDRAGELYISFRMRVFTSNWGAGTLAAAIARYDASAKTWTMLGGTDYVHGKKAFFWEEAGVHSKSDNYKDSPSNCATGSYQPYGPHVRFDVNNRMHVTWVADEGEVPNRSFCSASGHHTHALYAASDDGGTTFKRADGTPIVSLPIRLATADVVAGPAFAKTIGGFSYRSHVEVLPDGRPVVQILTEKSSGDSAYLSFWEPGSGWTTPKKYPSAYRGAFLIDSHGVITSVGFGGSTGLARSFDLGKSWQTYSGIEAMGHSVRFDYAYFNDTNQIRFYNRFSGTRVSRVWTVLFSDTQPPATAPLAPKDAGGPAVEAGLVDASNSEADTSTSDVDIREPVSDGGIGHLTLGNDQTLKQGRALDGGAGCSVGDGYPARLLLVLILQGALLSALRIMVGAREKKVS